MTKKSVGSVSIGSVRDFPERLGKTVCVGDMEVAVFKLLNGSIRAVENRCPHKGGVLSEGMVSGEFVFCPMHDWKICLDNGEVQAPDTGCVKTYQTKIDGEEVFLLID
ncbi:nitrite reductase small subunit NirD [Neobacillus drentensis]|uniref:nitrite reductase small subunit NirD n=1 Tax=Neobacillus drentensis TaxID=220684 RepID=UPI0028637CA4|nr:nitrite reductase small subunit NirD [Neobacillus drentensis]MDR7236623.1 nitrite reductase (NADH) small subunit [Neobacillus drentensis]